MQNNRLHRSFRLFYKGFTSLLQVFTDKKLQGCIRLIPLLHCFTISIQVMHVINFFGVLVLFQLLSCNQASKFPQASQLSDNLQNQKNNKTVLASIVFRSADNGQTWQDISKGLPENLREDSIRGNSFFTNDKGLYLRVGNEFYHSTPNATTAFWTKEVFTDEYSSIALGKNGKLAYNYWGVNLKKTNGTSVWSPVFENFQEPRIRSVFETTGGTIFIGTDRGLFKTVNSGTTWKHVYSGGLVGNLAESNGVLLATGMRKIIRSTDDGENWAVVNNVGNVVFDVKQIKDGFAAIMASSESNPRRLSTSYDWGKTWQPIDAGLQDKVVIDSIWRLGNDGLRANAFMTSIIKVGENFFCTHPDGIFKSSDKGKTWKLLLPSIKGKVFNLSVSGNVIYAIPSNRGC